MTVLPALIDSACLISPDRYRFYQQLHRSALDTTARVSDLLISSCAQSLQETQHAYEKLLGSYQASDRLGHADVAPHSTISKATSPHLKPNAVRPGAIGEAKAKARVGRRRSLVQRLAYGVGSLGAGVVIGLLLR
ncbi:MAG: hypothetical protein WA958_17200 [Tunicatimonas sp.]